MMDKMVYLSLVLAISIAFVPLSADEQPLLEFAGDLPDPDVEKYPITEHYFWEPPADFISGGFGFTTYRAKDNEDSNAILYAALVRPLVFHITETATLSCGIYGSGEHDFVEGGTAYMPEEIELNWRSQTQTYSVGASFFFSLPFEGEDGEGGSGIQCYLDIGHYWGKFFLQTDPYYTYIPGLPPLIPNTNVWSKFRWMQAESGIVGFLQFSYLINRLYLYGIHFVLSWSVPTGPRDVKFVERDWVHFSFQIPPLLVDFMRTQELAQDPMESHFISTMLYLRAFAVEIDMEDWFGRHFRRARITFEPALGISHYRMNKGHSFIWGARLNVFDVMGLALLMDHEVNNNVADRFIFSLELGFRFGRHINSSSRHGSRRGSNRLF